MRNDPPELIKAPNERSPTGLIEFIFNVRRALHFSENEKQQMYVLKKAANCIVHRFEILPKRHSSWIDFKFVLYIGFGINETVEELRERLGNVHMDEKTLDAYYQEVLAVTRALAIMEYDARGWNEMMSVLLEVEEKAVEAFINGLDIDYVTFLMHKDPKTLKDAYEIVKDKMRKDNEKRDPPKPIQTCATLLLDTNLSENRKYLFHVWPQSPGNFIKYSSLPPGQTFAWIKVTLKGIAGVIEAIGVIHLYINFEYAKLGPVAFYVLPETSNVEDDGIIQFFGHANVMETDNGFIFIHKTDNGRIKETKMGLDCPNRGKCGHWPIELWTKNAEAKKKKT